MSISGTRLRGSGLTNHHYGIAAGVDTELDASPVLVGGSISGSWSDFALNAPSASGDSWTFGASVYAVARMGAAYASGIAFVGGGNSIYTSNLNALGLQLMGSAHFSNMTFGLRGETGYSFDFAALRARLTPFVAVQPTWVHQSSAKQIFGSLDEGVNFAATTIDTLPTYLGVQLDGEWDLKGGGILTPFIRAAWRHDFHPERIVRRSFTTIPTVMFGDTGIATVSDAGTAHFGLQYSLPTHITLFGSADLETSSAYRRLGGTIGLNFAW